MTRPTASSTPARSQVTPTAPDRGADAAGFLPAVPLLALDRQYAVLRDEIRGALDRVADASPGTPAVWGAKLRELGYTHVLINPTMLVVWKKAGWMNPQLEPDRWLTAFLQANPSVRTSDGCFIVELATQQTAPQPAPAAAPAPSADRPPSAS